MVDDLDGVRRALGLDRVATLGHSAHVLLALASSQRIIVPYASGPAIFPDPTFDCTPLRDGHDQLLSGHCPQLDERALFRSSVATWLARK